MSQNSMQAQSNEQSGYYLFCKVDSLNEDISWSGIAQEYKNSYMYFDGKSNTISYCKKLVLHNS